MLGAVRAVLHRRLPHAVGRSDQRRRCRQRPRSGATSSRTPSDGSATSTSTGSGSTPCTPSSTRPPSRSSRSSTSAVHAAAHAAGRTALVTIESSANDPRIVRSDRRTGGAATRCGTTTCTTRCGWPSPASATSTTPAYAGRRRPRHGVGTTDGCTAVSTRPGFGRRHGAPADDVDHRHFIVFAQNHDHVGNTPAGDRLLADAGRRRSASPARRRGGAAVAVHPDAVHGRGVRRAGAVPVLHRPRRPRAGRGRPQGRRREFSGVDWSGARRRPRRSGHVRGPRSSTSTLSRARAAPRRGWRCTPSCSGSGTSIASSPTRRPSSTSRPSATRSSWCAPFPVPPRRWCSTSATTLCDHPAPDPAATTVFDSERPATAQRRPRHHRSGDGPTLVRPTVDHLSTPGCSRLRATSGGTGHPHLRTNGSGGGVSGRSGRARRRGRRATGRPATTRPPSTADVSSASTLPHAPGGRSTAVSSHDPIDAHRRHGDRRAGSRRAQCRANASTLCRRGPP